jgi:hypothetical protein
MAQLFSLLGDKRAILLQGYSLLIPMTARTDDFGWISMPVIGGSRSVDNMNRAL